MSDPFDLQTILKNSVDAQRAEQMKSSPQLTLGELILKLEHVDQTKTVSFGFEHLGPTTFDSWRGIYAEIAIGFGEVHSKPVSEFLQQCRDVLGATFNGYKGGDYTMGKTTPVWVANYGNAGQTAIVDVREYDYEVVLVTAYVES